MQTHPFFVKVMIKKEPLFINDYFVYQDSSLYTFTSDSILLSRFAKAKKGDIVADFCSGSGIVGLNFFALNEGLIKQLHLIIQIQLKYFIRTTVQYIYMGTQMIKLY